MRSSFFAFLFIALACILFSFSQILASPSGLASLKVAALDTPVENPVFHSGLLFSAYADPLQVNPPTASYGKGVVGFALNESLDTMWVVGQITSLSGAANASHIHLGVPGKNGPVLLGLDTFRKGDKLYGMLTGSKLSRNLIGKMLSDQTYVNFHTSLYPAGEIRGNIGLERDYSLSADLNGSQVVPAVSTTATGLAILKVSQNKARASLDILFQNLGSTLTGAELRQGRRGSNGSLLVDLMPFVSGNRISAALDMSALPSLADSLLAGSIYLNIRTANNPNGEIRGQLTEIPGLTFTVRLTGNQEKPPVSSAGMGLGYFHLNPTMDTISYQLMTDKLTGTATHAQLFSGTADTTGPMLLDLSKNINGNLLKGLLFNPDITRTLMQQLLSGKVYLNIQTTAFPDGEVRSQLQRQAREAYVFDMCGPQVVPPVAGNAGGTGIVSISSGLTDLRYMLMTDSLQGTPIALHFHLGKKAQQGPAVFDITPSFAKNSATGYWYDSSSTPLTPSTISAFQSGGMYVDVHTTADTAGEIRGQVMPENSFGPCLYMPTGIQQLPSQGIAGFSAWPVPFDHSLQFMLNSPEAGHYLLQMTDINGRQMLNRSISIEKGPNQFSIETAELLPGLYFIQILSEKGWVGTLKVVKG